MIRLINADELKSKFLEMGCMDDEPCYGAEIIDRMPTVKAVPIEKIQTLINDIEIMRTSPALIDNDDMQRFAENVLYALNRLIEESDDND